MSRYQRHRPYDGIDCAADIGRAALDPGVLVLVFGLVGALLGILP